MPDACRGVGYTMFRQSSFPLGRAIDDRVVADSASRARATEYRFHTIGIVDQSDALSTRTGSFIVATKAWGAGKSATKKRWALTQDLAQDREDFEN